LNPKNDAVFQYPKTQWNYDDEVWYDARPIDVNKLDNMMKSISEAAELLKVYTNHSVRATTITLWSNEQSLAHNITRPSISQLQHCSEVLSRSLTAESSFPSSTASRTAINTRTQIQEQITMTAGTTSSSYLGSPFNNCTVQQAHVHVTFGSDFSKES